MASLTAVVMDGAAVLTGFMTATWLRFDSGWFPVSKGRPADLYLLYFIGAVAAGMLFLLIFRALGLFVRPQIGSFVNKIPRIVKAVTAGEIGTAVLAFAMQNEFKTEFSRGVLIVSFFTILFFVLLERYILFRAEWNLARHSVRNNKVLIIGADSVAVHLWRVLQREPMLRSRVIGFVRTGASDPAPDIPADMILGDIDGLEKIIASTQADQAILTGSVGAYEKILEIIVLCERHMTTFNMVPDLFRLITTNMDVQTLDDIPLLGVSRWPLDFFWNRMIKRIIDVIGASVGLVLTAPVIAVAAVLIRKASPGPALYRQERCGEAGRRFTLHKLRTMPVDAEAGTGPVWTSENDSRRTKIGVFLRRHNLDELPQLWNVLVGDMSLVGPRPERPHFVEQFKEGVSLYMRRHVSKPGMTGWAQINGLRGNTSIEERVKYDLYYLENWSPAFDFKILLRTLFARKNAY